MRLNQRFIFVPRLLLTVIVPALLLAQALKLLLIAGQNSILMGLIEPLQKLQTMGLMFLAVFAGGSRAMIHHPMSNARYRQWLITSPWNPRMPLPLGPITLSWQDLLFLIALILLTWFIAPPTLLLWPAIVFLSVFVLLTIAHLADTRQYTAVIILGYCIAAAIQLCIRPPFLLLALIGLYAIEHVALRQSLWTFPWKSNQPARPRMNIGWPFEQLAPRPLKPAVFPLARNLIAATELGAWVFSIAQLFYSDNPRHGLDVWMVFPSAFVLCLFLGRWITYTNGYSSPITFFGRLATGNWIIPNYDRVLIAPFCTLLIGAILIIAMNISALYPPLKVALCFMIPLFLTMSIGPSLQNWKLTGAHQIRRTAQANNKNQRRRRHRESSSLAALM